MKVFRDFTLRSLLKNRSRTVVTIIGIMLSVALVTAVLEGAYSGVQFMIRADVESVGAFHGAFRGMDAGDIETVSEDDEIQSVAAWYDIGWAEIDGTNDDKPYFKIVSMQEELPGLVSIRLTRGRLPQAPGEIIIPANALSNGGINVNVGDVLDLAVGQRTYEGYPLGSYESYQSGETLEAGASRRYTVVGVYERFDRLLEPYYLPGYTAITFGEKSDECDIFFTVKKVSNYYSFVTAQNYCRSYVDHTSLLRLYGSVRSATVSTVIYGFAGVLIFLIAFGSISLIYNSFSISVSERTHQFGILRSIGATKRQIRFCVIYEALLLSVSGIVLGLILGCVGIGVTLWALRDAFGYFVKAGDAVQMKLVISPVILLIAAAISLVTTLISAWIPSARARSISAIDAVRQSRDVRLRPKEIRVSGLIQKLFGFEGMMASKNFKRNRKRYRSTVVSLFLSVTLFISASSFCDYLTNSVRTMTSNDASFDVAFTLFDTSLDEIESFYKKIMELDGIKKSTYYVGPESRGIHIDSALIDTELLNNNNNRLLGVLNYPAEGDQTAETFVFLVFQRDVDYKALLKENGLQDSVSAVVYNEMTIYDVQAERWYTARLFSQKTLPAEISVKTSKTFEGYTFIGYEHRIDAETGAESVYKLYYPTELMDNDGDGATDPEKMLFVAEKDSYEDTALTVEAVIKEPPFGLARNHPALVLPYSRLSEFESGSNLSVNFCFTADDHAKLAGELKTLLESSPYSNSGVSDLAEDRNAQRMLVTVINVFSYGFVILISLIAIANVFNTISTNIMLRRREFAMLRSVGMSQRGFGKMMRYESVIYGVKGLVYGLPAAVLMTYLIYRVTKTAVESSFYIPWYSVAIAVGSVFAVVFTTMLYSSSKISRENVLDALKNENL